MKKITHLLVLSILLILFAYSSVSTQVNARLFRYPDVSKDKITFTYAGDIWIVNKSGGTAQKISSAAGEEIWPKFSPDGKTIAFSANYDGNTDVYVIPGTGGIPARLTYHGYYDQVLDWHPDGKNILFLSSRESGRQRYSQFFVISSSGGQAEKLPVPYGEMASMNSSGTEIIYTDKSRIRRSWKRYEGGMAPDLMRFNLKDFSHERISPHIANDEIPMWHGDKVYFLSDRGKEKRFNIWVYDLKKETTKQLTNFKNFDIHFPSIGPEDIVFEADGKLQLMNLKDHKIQIIKIQVIMDFIDSKPKFVNVNNLTQKTSVSHDGKRVLVEARGDIFSVPAENGYVKNLTNSSGSAQRYPAWSPDGKKLAFWSDASGEYQLHIMDGKTNKEQILTNYSSGYRYNIFWSPDNKNIAFIDQTMSIQLFNFNDKTTTKIDQGLRMFHGPLDFFSVSWSPDSQYLCYSRGEENSNQSIFIYDLKDKKTHPITSSYYSDYSPVFDQNGAYLYFVTSRNFQPAYSDFENTFIYSKSGKLAVIPLQKDLPSVLPVENDEVAIVIDTKEEKTDSTANDKKDEKPELAIDFSNLESKIELLPLPGGNYSDLAAVEGKLIFMEYPESGSRLNYFDIKEAKTKLIMDKVSGYELTADRKKILVSSHGKFAVIDCAENQKMEKPLRLDEMSSYIAPKEEWKQIFNDVWRLERDFFYDKNMHGVDWNKMKEYYGNLINHASTRWDVNFIIGELIGELNASHTYRYGGDVGMSNNRNVGYLGADLQASSGYYKIHNIVQGASWDVEHRSPLSKQGSKIKIGDHILAVNGMPLYSDKEAFVAFQGLAGKAIELIVSNQNDLDSTRKVVVQTIGDESPLRHQAWMESNRNYVDKASGGRIGYIYVRSTGIDGQNELVRQFYGQWHKDALIIDERFNSGGQIPDRFIELLNRKPLANWAVRDGQNWQWPPKANFGPKAMLINGWSGSGGDAFPDYFKKSGMGPLIGTRTWGGLIGISGAPALIDGGVVTVPTFRMYNTDGSWFKEGHGVDPDIEVLEDPTKLAKGIDTQLDKAVQWLLDALINSPEKLKGPEPYENR